MRVKPVFRLLGEPFDGPVVLRAEKRNEPPCERKNVVRTVPERGNREFNHIEPVEQILSKRALVDAGLQILIRRGQKPNVRRARDRVADALALLGLNEAQELGLEAERQVANFVEQERPVLAAQNNGYVFAGDLPGRLDHLLHGRTVRIEWSVRLVALRPVFEKRHLALQRRSVSSDPFSRSNRRESGHIIRF